jgi:hypothetical protein
MRMHQLRQLHKIQIESQLTREASGRKDEKEHNCFIGQKRRKDPRVFNFASMGVDESHVQRSWVSGQTRGGGRTVSENEKIWKREGEGRRNALLDGARFPVFSLLCFVSFCSLSEFDLIWLLRSSPSQTPQWIWILYLYTESLLHFLPFKKIIFKIVCACPHVYI